MIGAIDREIGRQPDRPINFSALWKVKMFRHYPDHRALDIVDGDRLIDDVWIAAEASLPETVGDDRYCVSSGLVLFFSEAAAHYRLHSSHVDEISGDEEALEALRGIDSGKVRVPPAIKREVFERLALGAPIEVVRRGHFVMEPAAKRVPVPDSHHAIDFRKSEGFH